MIFEYWASGRVTYAKATIVCVALNLIILCAFTGIQHSKMSR
jgi:hypothetical protein